MATLKTIDALRAIPEGSPIAVRLKFGAPVAGIYGGIVSGRHDASTAQRRADNVIVTNGCVVAHIPDYDFVEAVVDRRRKLAIES